LINGLKVTRHVCGPAGHARAEQSLRYFITRDRRVRRYQEAVVKEAMRVMASMGVTEPGGLTPHMLMRRDADSHTRSYAEIYQWLAPGQLLAEPPEFWAADWARATPDSFAIAA